MTPDSALAWATANYVDAETLCDKANDVSQQPLGPAIIPDLTPAGRELESALLGRLQVRPGGLDPHTPSRTRDWLWRGLGMLLLTSPVIELSAPVDGEWISADADDPTETIEE